jgi:hypothetical protein
LDDPGGKVALDCGLADDHRPPPEGIRVHNDLTYNGYVDPSGKNDQHNSCGFLQSLALSDVVRGFLAAEMGSETIAAWRLTGSRGRSCVSLSQRDVSEAPVSGW